MVDLLVRMLLYYVNVLVDDELCVSGMSHVKNYRTDLVKKIESSLIHPLPSMLDHHPALATQGC